MCTQGSAIGHDKSDPGPISLIERTGKQMNKTQGDWAKCRSSTPESRATPDPRPVNLKLPDDPQAASQAQVQVDSDPAPPATRSPDSSPLQITGSAVAHRSRTAPFGQWTHQGAGLCADFVPAVHTARRLGAEWTQSEAERECERRMLEIRARVVTALKANPALAAKRTKAPTKRPRKPAEGNLRYSRYLKFMSKKRPAAC